jgi:hypothetical protein
METGEFGPETSGSVEPDLITEERRQYMLQFCMTDAEREHVDPKNIYGTMETKLPETATGPEP